MSMVPLDFSQTSSYPLHGELDTTELFIWWMSASGQEE